MSTGTPNVMVSDEINVLAGNKTNNVIVGNLTAAKLTANNGIGQVQILVDSNNNVGIVTSAVKGGVTPDTLHITVDGSPTPGLVMDTHGNVFAGYQGVVATDAVNGFLYIPKCAGTPTGFPADLGHGMLPLVIDYTNSKMYFHNGTSWIAVN